MKIHFIGIGGIGISALARYYFLNGHEITGSDLVSSEITDALQKMGAKIIIGSHRQENVPDDVDMVIYSPAITLDNPELKKAHQLIRNYKLQTINPEPERSSVQGRKPNSVLVYGYKLKVSSYPEALGELTKKYFTIAVCGTHGKSTTTSMIGLLLTKAGLDPTVIVGTKLKEFGDSNFRMGRSINKDDIPTVNYPSTLLGTGKLSTKNYLVIEADEHMASFLNYWPKIIVLTRLEADHLDYYKNIGNIFRAFKKFINHLPNDGLLVANEDDSNILRMLNSKSEILNPKQIQKLKSKMIFYTLKQKETGKLRKILKIPGEHNVSNALAALAVARALNIPDKIAFKALSQYKGAWRRFEVLEADLRGIYSTSSGLRSVSASGRQRGKTRRITIVSDYGHHPTEVEVTLKAAREKFGKRKIWCIFQPHQYQRTYYLFKDFVRVLSRVPVDKLIITDIYSVAGRESDRIKKLVNSRKLVEKVKTQPSAKNKDILYIPTIEQAKQYLVKNLQGREVVIIMGAGDIYNLVKLLK